MSDGGERRFRAEAPVFKPRFSIVASVHDNDYRPTPPAEPVADDTVHLALVSTPAVMLPPPAQPARKPGEAPEGVRKGLQVSAVKSRHRTSTRELADKLRNAKQMASGLARFEPDHVASAAASTAAAAAAAPVAPADGAAVTTQAPYYLYAWADTTTPSAPKAPPVAVSAARAVAAVVDPSNRRTQLHVLAGEADDVAVSAIAQLQRTCTTWDWGMLLNAKDRYGCTPLMLAARSGREGVVALLASDSDAGAANDARLTALHIAAAAGEPAILRKLLQVGGNATAVDGHKRTCLFYACACLIRDAPAEMRSAGLRCLEVLLAGNTGAAAGPDADGVSVIVYAAAAGYLPAVRLLCTRLGQQLYAGQRVGAGGSSTGGSGGSYHRTPAATQTSILHAMAAAGMHEALAAILDCAATGFVPASEGEEEEEEEEEGTTAAWSSGAWCSQDSGAAIEAVRDLLVQQSSDPCGDTVLHAAVRYGQVRCVKAVLVRAAAAGLGAEVWECRSGEGLTPLQLAATGGTVEEPQPSSSSLISSMRQMVQKALQPEAAVGTCDAAETTSVSEAQQTDEADADTKHDKRMLEITAALLYAGARVTPTALTLTGKPRRASHSPLALAIGGGQLRLAALLLQHGAVLDATAISVFQKVCSSETGGQRRSGTESASSEEELSQLTASASLKIDPRSQRILRTADYTTDISRAVELFGDSSLLSTSAFATLFMTGRGADVQLQPVQDSSCGFLCTQLAAAVEAEVTVTSAAATVTAAADAPFSLLVTDLLNPFYAQLRPFPGGTLPAPVLAHSSMITARSPYLAALSTSALLSPASSTLSDSSALLRVLPVMTPSASALWCLTYFLYTDELPSTDAVLLQAAAAHDVWKTVSAGVTESDPTAQLTTVLLPCSVTQVLLIDVCLLAFAWRMSDAVAAAEAALMQQLQLQGPVEAPTFLAIAVALHTTAGGSDKCDDPQLPGYALRKAVRAMPGMHPVAPRDTASASHHYRLSRCSPVEEARSLQLQRPTGLPPQQRSPVSAVSWLQSITQSSAAPLAAAPKRPYVGEYVEFGGRRILLGYRQNPIARPCLLPLSAPLPPALQLPAELQRCCADVLESVKAVLGLMDGTVAAASLPQCTLPRICNAAAQLQASDLPIPFDPDIAAKWAKVTHIAGGYTGGSASKTSSGASDDCSFDDLMLMRPADLVWLLHARYAQSSVDTAPEDTQDASCCATRHVISDRELLPYAQTARVLYRIRGAYVEGVAGTGDAASTAATTASSASTPGPALPRLHVMLATLSAAPSSSATTISIQLRIHGICGSIRMNKAVALVFLPSCVLQGPFDVPFTSCGRQAVATLPATVSTIVHELPRCLLYGDVLPAADEAKTPETAAASAHASAAASASTSTTAFAVESAPSTPSPSMSHDSSTEVACPCDACLHSQLPLAVSKALLLLRVCCCLLERCSSGDEEAAARLALLATRTAAALHPSLERAAARGVSPYTCDSDRTLFTLLAVISTCRQQLVQIRSSPDTAEAVSTVRGALLHLCTLALPAMRLLATAISSGSASAAAEKGVGGAGRLLLLPASCFVPAIEESTASRSPLPCIQPLDGRAHIALQWLLQHPRG